MKIVLRIAVACTALFVLVVQGAAAQGAAPTLTESPTSGFPDKAYILGLGSKSQLKASQVDVTENGQPVLDVAVAPAGGSSSGAVLLIDASNSMKGKPIEGATVAARAFLVERKKDLPTAILAFNPNVNVL